MNHYTNGRLVYAFRRVGSLVILMRTIAVELAGGTRITAVSAGGVNEA